MSNPARNNNQGLYWLTVIQDLVSVQIISSLRGDVKPCLLHPSLLIVRGRKEPTLLFEKSRSRKPRKCGLSIMGEDTVTCPQ